MPGFGRFAAVLTLLCLAVPSAAVTGPARDTSLQSVRALSFVAVDGDSGRVLAARGETARRPIASLTKVMTALAVIERGNLGARVVVTPAATRVEPYVEGLVPGRAYRRDTLLWSALLASGNDSATALAIDAGGGSLSSFYALANRKARTLGMASTTYASASGLDDVRNLSTALDQAILARAALRNPTFAQMVGTRTHWTKWAAPTYAKIWVNHNRMLADDTRHLWGQDRLDDAGRRLPDRRRAPGRSGRDRRPPRLPEHLDGHGGPARRRLQRGSTDAGD